MSAFGSTWVDGTQQAFNTLGDVVAVANDRFMMTFGASTNQTPILYTFEIRGGDHLQGRFMFLNDADASLTLDDLVMSYAVSNLATSFITF